MPKFLFFSNFAILGHSGPNLELLYLFSSVLQNKEGLILMKIKPILKGFSTFIPGVQKILPEKGTGGTKSALYCYEVWLKHLILLYENGLHKIPNTMAEIGPGDSLGIGLAALLSGVNNYYALDVVKYSDVTTNLRIFDELVLLFKTRAGRPTKGWPDYDKYLPDDLFPNHILSDEMLDASLSDERIMRIRNAITNPNSQNEGIIIKYLVPWFEHSIIEHETVDVIVSHAVMEHVSDLNNTYNSLYLWLKPNGLMSHQIDLTCHGLSKQWNGYRKYSELLWKIIVGKRPFLINRQPCSVHADLLGKYGFKIVCYLKRHRNDGIHKSQLSPYWRTISDDDLTCSGIFIQAQKRLKK